MVDPFASTNPATATNQNPPKAESTDVFGGVPDIFSDMAATAFQPIDPETGRPTEHTPETLDPFLRDENKNIISSDSFVAFGDDAGLNKSIEDSVMEVPIEEQDTPSVALQDDAFLAPPSPTYQPPMPEETAAIQEDVSFADELDVDSSEETNSYFETIPSFDITEEPVQLSEQEQEDSIIQTQEPVIADDVVVADSISDKNATQAIDHYDPFVDSVSDVSVANPITVDDPFLVDVPLKEEELPTHEEVVQQDPFLENSVDNGLQEMPDSQASSVMQDQPDNMEQSTIATTEESLVQDVVIPQLEPVDPFLLDHDAVDVSLASEVSVDTSMPTEAIPADDESPVVDLEPIVSENSDENQQSQDIPTTPETSVAIEDEQVADETSIIDPREVAVSSEEALASHETVSSLQEQSDVVSVSEPEGPSMLQGLVEGMLDPFSSNSPLKDDGSETVPIKEEMPPEAIVADEEMQELDPVIEQTAPTVASMVEDEEVVDDDQENQSSVSEPTVNEDEQDMQKSGLSDVFVKFQELLGSIYRVHDIRGEHDAFTVVGADNDALYITYTFAIEASAEQAIVITKESTDRKDNDTIDTHMLRFAINTNSLVEVYVDGVLLFVEDQLVDNVKAKMQLMDKFNKFIFLINQFIQDSTNQASGDAVVSAQEEFGGF